MKGRGVQQGCPASPGIYTQTSAIISHMLTGNENIKGIHINDIEYILSMFADDTAAFLKYDPICIEAFCEELSRVEKQFELKVSYDKTSLYHVGSLFASDAQCYTTKPLRWTSEPFNSLGIQFNCDGSTNLSNFEKVMQRVTAVCNQWCNRILSLMGKIVIINTLIRSLFVYNMMVMINLTVEQQKEVYKAIHSLLWNGKQQGRINIKTLCKCKEDGGLRLLDLSAKQDALKIKGIFTLEQELLQLCYNELRVSELGEKIWTCNLDPADVEKLFEQSFWAETWKAWCKINFQKPVGRDKLAKIPLWFNSELHMDGKPIYWKEWYKRGIVTVDDIFEDGKLKPWETIKDQYNVDWFNWHRMTTAIPKRWLLSMQEEKPDAHRISLYDSLEVSPKTVSRKAYDMIITDVFAVQKYWSSWKDLGLQITYYTYLEAFKHNQVITKISKYKDFQYRLLLNKLVFNVDLVNWNLKSSNSCSFCMANCKTLLIRMLLEPKSMGHPTLSADRKGNHY